MQVKHYLSITLLLAVLAACQTSPEVVTPQAAPQTRARFGPAFSASDNAYNYIWDYRFRYKSTYQTDRNSKLDAIAQKQVEYMLANNGSLLPSQLSTLMKAQGYSPSLFNGSPLLEQYFGRVLWWGTKSEPLETDWTKRLSYDSSTGSMVSDDIISQDSRYRNALKLSSFASIDIGIATKYNPKANNTIYYAIVVAKK